LRRPGALLRAIAVARIVRDELPPAVQTCPWLTVDPVLASTVSHERRGAVRADNPQVLDPVVCRGAVDVIEDQRHRLAAPLLPLIAQLTASLLYALVVEASFQMTPVIRGSFDQDLVQRRRAIAPGATNSPTRVHVLGRDAISLDQPVQRAMVSTSGSESESPQRLGEATRRSDRFADLLLGVARLPWHNRTLVRTSDGKAMECR
jgi:hypothetical protein